MLSLDLAHIAARASSGPAHELPGGGSLWAVWPLEPLMLVPLMLVGLLYAAGLRRWPDRSREHPSWRTALFYTGLAITLLSVTSPLHLLAERHFSMHMVQHMLVIMAGVPLALLGAPTTPVLRGMPRWLRLGVVRALSGNRLVRRAFRAITHPLVALLLFSAVLWAWHLAPGWYDAAAADEGLHNLQHLSFTLTALLFWWNVIDPAPLHASMGHLMRMVYLVAQGTVQAFLGAFITLVDRPLYEFYVRAEPILNLSVMDDQQLGGLIMWVAPGSLVNLGAIGVLFAVWYRESERQQQAQDAERDRAAGRVPVEG